MRRCILENPVTHQKIELVEAKADTPHASHVSRMLFQVFGRTLGPSLFRALGRPREALGKGSFAIVFADPRRPATRVIKVSMDPMDGRMAAAVQALQAQGKLRGLVSVHAVWRLKNFKDFMRPEEQEELESNYNYTPGELWIIFTERVTPLKEASEQPWVRGHESAPEVARTIGDTFRDHLKEMQSEVLEYMAKEAGEGGDWSVLPEDLRKKMLKAMKWFAEELLRSAENLDSPGSKKVLRMAAASVFELIDLGLPVVDLHRGNWGFRKNGDFVILDFGLSSVPSSAPANLTEIDLERRPAPQRPRIRKEHPGQMVMFNPAKLNAAFWKWFGKSKVVDAEGKPLVVYHGTAYGDIGVFRPERHQGVAGWFAFDPKFASEWAESRAEAERDIGDELSSKTGAVVYPVYLRAEKMFDVRKAEHRKKIGMKNWSYDYLELEEWVDAMAGAGFDSYLDFEGFKHKNHPTGIAVFHPTQIKSATGNRGTWDPKDPDIRRNPVAKDRRNIGKRVRVLGGGPFGGKTGTIVGFRGSDYASVNMGSEEHVHIYPFPRTMLERVADIRRNPVVGVPHEAGSAKQGWWVLPDGELVEIEYGADTGHLDYLFGNLKSFCLSDASVSKLEGLEVSDAALEKGAIRMLSAYEGGRLVIGADMDTRRLINWRHLAGALLEIGLPSHTPVFVLDPWKGGEETEKQTTVGELTGKTGARHNPPNFSRTRGEGDRDSIGLVPDQMKIDYMGFTVTMKPSEFLSLCPARIALPSKRLDDAIVAGQPIAPPFLEVEWVKDPGHWQVYGHEGRGRALSILKHFGDDPIPVDVLPQYMRARNVTAAMKKAPFVKDIRPNPAGEPYSRRGFCDLCKREPIEVWTDPRTRMHLCEECGPKMDAWNKRMDERNALVDRYAEFLRSVGSDFPSASSIEASDRFREKVWTAWEEGGNLPMGRTAAFKKWLETRG